MKEKGIVEHLEERTLLFDGAMGSLLLSQDLSNEDYRGRVGCCEILNLTRPELILEAHVTYLEAGADAIETNTFQASRLRLEEQGFGDLVREINLAAARIARKAADADQREDRRCYVVGSIGPTGRLPSSRDPELRASFSVLRGIIEEQARALIEGGVDALVLETQQDILETKAGILGIRDASAGAGRRVPLLVHIAIDKNGRMLMGTDVMTAAAILDCFDVTAIGIDCSFGPDEMREHIRVLAEVCPRYISCIPNAGLPVDRDGLPFYPLRPAEMAETLVGMAEEYAIDIIGGCCGTTPAHIREIRERLVKRRPPKRNVERIPSVASSFKRVALRQDPRPLLIGEKLNATGSRRTREIVEEGDYGSLVAVAREQVSDGCHLLDVCMAGPAEKERMEGAVLELSQSIEAPLVIDTREEDVILACLQIYPGRCLVNSLNMERGKQSFVRLLSLVREYGACAVAMTITESGIALTAKQKLEAVRLMREIAVREVGYPADQILFDLVTLPISASSGEYAESARETLLAVSALKKEFPDALTILGISNVSYGLPTAARKLLNSTFLYHAIVCGLAAAVVNAGDLVPYRDIPAAERGLCEDLIFNKGEDSLSRLLDLLDKGGRKIRPEPLLDESASSEEAIRARILNRNSEGIESLLDRAVEAIGARQVVDGVLLPAMEEVGRRFDTGEMILPFVLQAGEVMSRAMKHLERHLGQEGAKNRGKVVLATVFGDVHDIGKNLVRQVMSNNGYMVYDLGKRVPVDDIVERARETCADVIGLSALLVSTAREMKACVLALSRMGMTIPVIIGGAAVSRDFARRISILDDGSVYEGGVFYARDAFEGLEILNSLARDRKAMLAKYRGGVLDFIEKRKGDDAAVLRSRERRTRREAINVPFKGRRAVKSIDPTEVFPYLDRGSLFRKRWSGKGEERELASAFEELRQELARKRLLDLALVYGYFDCEVGEDSIVIESGGSRTVLTFPGESVILEFMSAPGDKDIAALAVVTAGAKVKAFEDGLLEKGETKKAFYLHGLSAEMTDALASHLEVKMGMELGLEGGMGRRFSPGYPSWPDLSEQEKIFSVLKPREEIGVSLTESFQMVPEHSISFLFCPRSRRAPRGTGPQTDPAQRAD
jgi:5-methyltetrahydrofolate--homocysteine methyltransferase